MILNLRSIVVAVAILIALGGVGWFAASDGSSGANPSVSAASKTKPRAGAGAPVGVLVARVTKLPFAAEMEAIGTAHANEAVDITAKVSNRVTAIRFREGQQVKEGDVLVELDGEQARATLAQTEAALGDSRSQFNRSRELYQTKALSEAQLDQLQATLAGNEARVAGARSQLNDTIVRAPFAGRVGLRNVSLGGLVSPGAVITTLDDTSVIKLDFSVPEVFLATLAEGQEITARTAAYPDKEFKGRVSGIDSRLDPVSRSLVVRARIDNRDARLKPGMLMTARLVRSEAAALMIPEQAIVPEGERKFVYVVRGGKAARADVQTGRRRPGEVEILNGLAEGEQIVVEGQIKIREGTAVKAMAVAEQPS
jgi:membrane fusion protein (multidrug efflux system)